MFERFYIGLKSQIAVHSGSQKTPVRRRKLTMSELLEVDYGKDVFRTGDLEWLLYKRLRDQGAGGQKPEEAAAIRAN